MWMDPSWSYTQITPPWNGYGTSRVQSTRACLNGALFWIPWGTKSLSSIALVDYTIMWTLFPGIHLQCRIPSTFCTSRASDKASFGQVTCATDPSASVEFCRSVFVNARRQWASICSSSVCEHPAEWERIFDCHRVGEFNGLIAKQSSGSTLME